MRRLVFSVLVCVLASTSLSVARQSTLNMSCGQAAALVERSGGVVLSTGRYTYSKFVARRHYCELGFYADWGYAPTRDARSCRIGYVCKPGPAPWEEDRFLLDR